MFKNVKYMNVLLPQLSLELSCRTAILLFQLNLFSGLKKTKQKKAM